MMRVDNPWSDNYRLMTTFGASFIFVVSRRTAAIDWVTFGAGLDPTGNPIIDPLTGQQFPGNIIPPSQLDPVALKVLETIPLPNQPNGLLYYTVASSQ